MTIPPKPDTAPKTLADSFGTTRAVLSNIATDYMQAADSYSYNQIRREQTALHNDEVGLLTGNLTTDQVSRPVSIPASILKAQEEKQKRDQRAADDLLLYVHMDQMRDRWPTWSAAWPSTSQNCAKNTATMWRMAWRRHS